MFSAGELKTVKEMRRICRTRYGESCDRLALGRDTDSGSVGSIAAMHVQFDGVVEAAAAIHDAIMQVAWTDESGAADSDRDELHRQMLRIHRLDYIAKTLAVFRKHVGILVSMAYEAKNDAEREHSAWLKEHGGNNDTRADADV